MELQNVIKGRRSIRNYTGEGVSKEIVRELLDTAVWSPSASNIQPWGFVVIQDKEYMKELSNRAKAGLLAQMITNIRLEQYRAAFENPTYNIFYEAPVLIVIYGHKGAFHAVHDCSMAAQNLMLAAWDRGLGTCWIGFAHGICNSTEFKMQHGVSEDYDLIGPIVVGHPGLVPKQPVPRKEYPIFAWELA